MIDWRALFDEIRVDWKDRGANTSRGHVNICCPYCVDDDGFHLSVKEETGVYYCRRRGHSGRFPEALIVRLGQGRVEAVRLLNMHQGIRERVRTIDAPSASALRKDWDRFPRACQSDAMLDYLYSRGFPDPLRVANRFDLRYGRFREWHGRLLLPLHDGTTETSWTGRATMPGMTPKYLDQKTDVAGLICCPAPRQDIMVVVEGPLDALKIAAAVDGFAIGDRMRVGVIALTGKNISEKRVWRVRAASAGVRLMLLAIDADTGIGESSRIMSELRMATAGAPLYRLPLPAGRKDPGEMPLPEIRDWLGTRIDAWQAADASVA